MTTQNENQMKADAINEFVTVMIGAFESGFTDRNHLTLSELHQIARHHVNDNYGVELPSIVEQWGKEVANDCGLGEQKIKGGGVMIACNDEVKVYRVVTQFKDSDGMSWRKCEHVIADTNDHAKNRVLELECKEGLEIMGSELLCHIDYSEILRVVG